MKYKNEIFDNFYKIALEKDLIDKEPTVKTAEEKSRPTSNKMKQPSDRPDPLSIKEIAKLFDGPKKEYKKTIMELAHPESAVLFTSYDKVNSLVENNMERQNIMLNLITRKPSTQLFNEKYAKSNLINNLVRLGNFFDSKDNTIEALADTSLQQLSNVKSLANKYAFAPIAIGVAAAITALYAQQHLPTANQGFKLNSERLVKEIDDLISSNSNYGIGYTFKASFTNFLTTFKTRILETSTVANKAEEVISDLETPKSGKELLAQSQQPESKAADQAFQSLQASVLQANVLINQVLKNFSSEDFKNRQIEQKGALTSVLDSAQVLHGGKGMIEDDFDDVVDALQTYKKSLLNVLAVVKAAASAGAKAKETLEAAQSEVENSATPQKQEQNVPSEAPKKSLKSDLEEEFSNTEQKIKNLF